MSSHNFHVYAIKDPRTSPARPFYVGKGTEIQSHEDLMQPDDSPRYARIEQIFESGHKPVVDIMIEDLTEDQAARLEAELIAAFGTEETGGLLTNLIVPRENEEKRHDHLVVPQGCLERAHIGLDLLKGGVLGLVKANPGGVTHGEVADTLRMPSLHGKSHTDHLPCAMLELLMEEGKIARSDTLADKYVARGMNS